MILMQKVMNTFVAAGAALSLVTLSACGSTGSQGSGKTLDVVTAFYPFQYVAEQVGGSHVKATSLTAAGAEPHDLALTPKQVVSLGEADVVVYQKGFQTSVDKAVSEANPKHAVDTTTVVSMMKATGTDEEGNKATGDDPHEWLLPTNMAATAQAVEKQLSAVDPDNASTYQANAKAFEQKMTELDGSFKTGLSQCTRKDFITSHAAFGYLAKRYGLTQVGISGLSPDEQPSPARIAQVQKLAKQTGVTTIFYETLVSPAQAKAIAGDMGLKTDVLDPLEGITSQSRGSDYIAVQKANLTALQKANGCK